jgi:hypothetical protein
VLSLEISDNGRGLSAEDLAKARSVRHPRPARAGRHGRRLDRTEQRRGGTTLMLSVPLDRSRWHWCCLRPNPMWTTSWGEL